MRAGAVWRRHEGVAVDEALAVEVADVRRAVDGHGARDEVMMAPAEVVQALVLGRRHRDDRLDGRGEPAAVRCGEQRRSEHQRRRCERVACFDATLRRASDELAVDAPGSVE